MSDITIYELRDPRTQETKYVGSTKHSVERALHMHQSNATVQHKPVNVWVGELRTLGLDTRNRVSGSEWVVSYHTLKWVYRGHKGVVSVSTNTPLREVGVSPCVGDSQITAYRRTTETRWAA